MSEAGALTALIFEGLTLVAIAILFVVLIRRGSKRPKDKPMFETNRQRK